MLLLVNVAPAAEYSWPKLQFNLSEFEGINLYDQLVMWCYENGRNVFWINQQRAKNSLDEFSVESELRASEQLRPECQPVHKDPLKLSYDWRPTIEDLSYDVYKASTKSATETLRLFVCDRIITALLGHPPAVLDKCPSGEQTLSKWLFMEVYGDINEMHPTVMVSVYGRSEFLALQKADYWESYRFAFQTIQQSAFGTVLVASIDEAAEEKNGLDQKIAQINGTIKPEDRKGVEALFNRITLAMVAE
jgi:hypothetical protein